VIQSATEIFQPKEAIAGLIVTNTGNASALAISLVPEPNEDPAAFQTRIEALKYGLHLIEFKKISETEILCLVGLNTSFPEAAPEDFEHLDKAELLRDLETAIAAKVTNKIEY
jgi:hypothetical protein